MKNSKYALLALLSAVTASSASAQSMDKDSGYYAEVGYTSMNTKYDKIGFDATPKLARFVVGKDINENLSIEGMYGVTVSKDSSQGDEISVDTYGIFLKPKMEISKDTEVFARLGYVKTQLKETLSSVSASSSGSDIGYGLGIQTKFSKDIFGQIDYMNYYNKNQLTFKGFTVSVGTRF